MEKISIIVPIYNVKSYLQRCVQSISRQTYRDLEIILIDDGSTDGSGELCDSFEDKRIKVFHKRNEGLGLSRNVGIKEATGKYVMFVDSDDYIDKTMVENLYKDLISNKADTCIGGYKRVLKDKTIKNINPLSGKVFESSQIIKDVLAKMMGRASKNDDHIEMSVWKVLFTLSIIKENNIVFPSERKFISEDIIFDTEYYTKCKRVCMSSDIGYNYCDNSNSLTTKYNPNRFKLQITLFEELKKRASNLNIYTFVDQRLYNNLIANTRYCIKLEQKFNPKNVALKNIKDICSNKKLNEVFSYYLDDGPLKSKVINKAIQRKRYNFLWWIMFAKNKLNI
ncbi:glycosyltransferase [Limosilactobacillus reuteri]|uniref:glycosyltransferase n=1 Tax=Limosilactobacillus reuteri TaxID=1598 RepID=UPI001E29CF96|nr:glycosyltransferase family 2 protein [Limosilactobacillus reuteri]MCC4357479.1 glycosyltransferase [Limosilactobacillus reuteri]MCC4361924.1 glycosyltransferase [Limosilactobacillus reuteri]MCC4363687.1 glycosyltransferase [Limosilactobacillus reuteri]